MPAGPIIREGQRMVLPGVGFEIRSGEGVPPSDQGVAGWIGQSPRGPLGKVEKTYGMSHLERIYGPTGVGGNTMWGAQEAFLGGAEAVQVIRVGSANAPAAKSTLVLKDTTPTTPLNVVTINSQYHGTDGNSVNVVVRMSVDAVRKDLVVYYAGQQAEVITFTEGTDGAQALVNAVRDQGSDYIDATYMVKGNGIVAILATTPLAGGVNPTITNNDYGTAIGLLVQQPFRAFGVDSETTALHTIVKTSVDAAIMAGRRRLGIVGEPTTVAWSTRVTNAKSLNDPALVYVATGLVRKDDAGNDVIIQGARAAGLEAGRHSILPLGRQMTYRPVRGATQTYETISGVGVKGAGLTDDQIEQAMASGMYFYLLSDTGEIVTAEGSTTYWNANDPPDWATSADIGWGRSRLVFTRFRLFDDIYSAWAPEIPDMSNNPAARESLIRIAKNVIEQKYQPRGAIGDYTLTLSPDQPPSGDEATFLLSCATPDGLERMRLIATFRR